MIKVTAEYGDKLSLKVEGHSENAPEGEDLICASASILAYTFAQVIHSWQDFLQRSYSEHLEKGNVSIECVPKKGCVKKFKAALDFAVVGFKLLEFNFPENVSVGVRNTKNNKI